MFQEFCYLITFTTLLLETWCMHMCVRERRGRRGWVGVEAEVEAEVEVEVEGKEEVEK